MYEKGPDQSDRVPFDCYFRMDNPVLQDQHR